MSKFKHALIFASCLILMTGCELSKKDGQAGGGPMGGPSGPVPVGVFTAKAADEPITLKYPAKVVSNQDVNVIAKVPGILMEQYFKAGDMVKEGDELFLIEPDKYEAAYEIAVANVELAKANYEKARLDYNRATRLKRSNSISAQEFDAATANYRATNAAIASAEANLKNISVDLNYTKVVAPFDGVLGDPYQDVGSYVGPQNPNLVRITKLDPLYAEFSIADVDALNISQKRANNEWEQKDAVATLKVGNKEYKGTTTFIDKVIDSKTGSVDAKAKFSNQNGDLLPHSFGIIEMSGFYQKNGFKIPQIAIQQDLSNAFVYVVAEGKATKSPIKITFQTSEYAIVSEGLNDGDQIIIDNFMKIGPGVPVTAVEGK
ncbi:MAG: efflux RND transporter periplasmic adaptor subunit [Campylobacteraceae bacterium]|nr:efflux RND transporter periplasmic adaptor subunit [Campylobacteraceae bacterium]